MIFKKRKKVRARLIFEGLVKRLDVRYGNFIWLKYRSKDKEFYSDVSIKRVIIDLPDGMLSKRVSTRTKDGLVKLRLDHILENLGDKHNYYKFITFQRPIRVRIFGIPKGDVDITFSLGKNADREKDDVTKEDR